VEANVNWEHNGTQAKFKKMTGAIWQNVAFNHSKIKEQFQSETQPGSAMTVITVTGPPGLLRGE
jgi:hypothetical protein